MSTIRTHSLLFALLSAIGTGASAETPLTRAAEQRVDHRQDRQERRIDQGVSSGALTAPKPAGSNGSNRASRALKVAQKPTGKSRPGKPLHWKSART